MLCDTVRGISKNTVQVPLNLHTILFLSTSAHR
jgi:hypothetical protein